MPTACCMSAPPDLQLFGFREITFDFTFLPSSLLTVAVGVSGYVWRRLRLRSIRSWMTRLHTSSKESESPTPITQLG